MRKLAVMIGVFALALLAPARARAAITVVQHSAATTVANQATVACTVSATASGNLIGVGTYNSGTMTVSSVTDNATGGSNTYTQFTGAHAVNAARETDYWYTLSAAHAGATTITVTFSASNTSGKVCFVHEVHGFTTAAIDLAATATGTSSSSTLTGASITTTSANGFAVGVEGTAGTTSVNPKAGNEFTSGGDITTSGNAACSLISLTAAAHQPVWTMSVDGAFAESTVSFKETAAAVARPPTEMTMGIGD